MAKSSTPSPTGGSTPGGAVEPTNRAAVAIQKFQAPEVAAERFELRDPSADVTYRPRTLEATIAKADQLGSSRFTIIAADGSRTPARKVGDEWRRGATLAPRPERPLDPGPARDEVPEAPGSSKAQANKDSAQQAQADAKALAKIDLQAERAAMPRTADSSPLERRRRAAAAAARR